MSDSNLKEGTYTFWKEDTQLQGVRNEMAGDMLKPEEIEILEEMIIPDEGMKKEEMKAPPEGGAPAKAQKGEIPDRLEGLEPPKKDMPEKGKYIQPEVDPSEEFLISVNNNYYRIY